MTINRTWAYNRHDTNYNLCSLIRSSSNSPARAVTSSDVEPTRKGHQPEFEERLRAEGLDESER